MLQARRLTGAAAVYDSHCDAEASSLVVARDSGQLQLWNAAGEQTSTFSIPIADGADGTGSQLVSLQAVPSAR